MSNYGIKAILLAFFIALTHAASAATNSSAFLLKELVRTENRIVDLGALDLRYTPARAERVWLITRLKLQGISNAYL